MRMDRAAQFSGSHLERPSEHDFGNHIGGVMADDLASDHFAVLLGRYDLDEPLRLIDRDRLAVGPEGDFANFDVETTGFSVRFT
jgi:hypothetical protein